MARSTSVTFVRLSIVIASVFLVACQSVVRTNIETFRDEKRDFSAGSIRIVSEDEVENPSLEFRYYRDKLEAKLAQTGYQPTESKDAEFIAKLGYRVSRQEKDRPNSRVVVGGHIGGFYPRSSILISDNIGSEFEYIREISLTIDQSQDSKTSRVVQVKATSMGRCEHLTVVYDEMLDAIFSQLIRPNGSVVNVSVKGDLKCP